MVFASLLSVYSSVNEVKRRSTLHCDARPSFCYLCFHPLVYKSLLFARILFNCSIYNHFTIKPQISKSSRFSPKSSLYYNFPNNRCGRNIPSLFAIVGYANAVLSIESSLVIQGIEFSYHSKVHLPYVTAVSKM